VISEEEAKKAWLAKLDAPTWGVEARPAVRRGKVKFYRQDKGWGYIEPENEEEIEVFVHYTSIKKDGWRSLMPGEPVEYTIVVKSDGRVACGTVTGPDGADVQGFDPGYSDMLSDPGQTVTEWLQKPVKEAGHDDDEVFDDTLYVYDNDFFSN
jgi:CspA family cold shock protein